MDKVTIHWPRSTFIGVTILATIGFVLVSGPFSSVHQLIVPSLIGFLLVLLGIAMFTVNHRTTRVIAFLIIVLLGAEMVLSLYVLIGELLRHEAQAKFLLYNGLVLWITNIGVFSVLYWEIDRGGPYRRHHHIEVRADFLFPQMGIPDSIKGAGWHPIYMDYLFLSFTTSTAFSPTDALPLSARAKGLMMVQAMISLTILVIIAARAINIA